MVGQKVEKNLSRKPSNVKRAKSRWSGRKSTSSLRDKSPITRDVSSSQSTSQCSFSERKSPEGAKMMQEEPACCTDMSKSTDSRTTGIIKEHLIELLQARMYPKTICPSEVARALSNLELDGLGVSDWRDLMNPIRAMLFDMRSNGEVEILQRGEVIPRRMCLEDIRGPIRARLVPT